MICRTLKNAYYFSFIGYTMNKAFLCYADVSG